MKKDFWIPVLTGLVMIALLVFASRTMPTILIFIPAVIVALIMSLSVTNKKTPEPSVILPLYLMALAIQCLHFAEEYVTGFCEIIPALFGQPPFPYNDWVIFNMVAYSIFILGGIILFRKMRSLMIIPLFFIVAAVFINTFGHILLSLWQMKYIPGFFTVFLYIPLLPRLRGALINRVPAQA